MVNVYFGKMQDIKKWLQCYPYLKSEDVVLYSCNYEMETMEIRDVNSECGVYHVPIPRYVLKDIKPMICLLFSRLEDEINTQLSEEYINGFRNSLPICFSFRDKDLDSQFEIEMNCLFDRVGCCSVDLLDIKAG